jgi:hypothetical protein
MRGRVLSVRGNEVGVRMSDEGSRLHQREAAWETSGSQKNEEDGRRLGIRAANRDCSQERRRRGTCVFLIRR